MCVFDISGERSVSGTGYSLKLVNSKWKPKIIFLWGGLFLFLFIYLRWNIFLFLSKEGKKNEAIYICLFYLFSL